MAEPSVLPPWLLLIVLGVVLATLEVAQTGVGPVFLIKPPITRRSKYYEMPLIQQCQGVIQKGNWTDWPLAASCDLPAYATCGEAIARRWQFAQRASDCGARRFKHQDAQGLLRDKWVVFAGDSITRMLFGALLRLAGGPGQAVLLKHQDFEYQLEGGIKATFLWHAYPSNLTDMFHEWEREQTLPTLVVSSVSLWHLLHITDPVKFGKDLKQLKLAASSYLSTLPLQPALLLADTTDTFTNRQPTAEKRQHMTPQNVDAYNKAMVKQGLLGRWPNEPFGLLDMFTLTNGCGEECSTDGIHSVDAVYDTALQLILNLYAMHLT